MSDQKPPTEPPRSKKPAIELPPATKNQPGGRPAERKDPPPANEEVLERSIETDPPAPIEQAKETKDRILP